MKKSSIATMLLASVLVTACGDEKPAQPASTASALTVQLEAYKSGANELVVMIRESKPDAQIVSKSAELVAGSKEIINLFMTKHPKCTAYLTALNAAADVIPTLPLEEIESGYHEDGKLPKFEDPNCYHAKDLLVHPATVQAMATMGINSDEMRKSAEYEIVEVIAHFSQVERALN